jgi:hypothetical protein
MALLAHVIVRRPLGQCAVRAVLFLAASLQRRVSR